MKIPTVEYCCGFIDLRIGGKIIGCTGMISNIISIVVAAFNPNFRIVVSGKNSQIISLEPKITNILYIMSVSYFTDLLHFLALWNF